jgi:hypothetical protein
MSDSKPSISPILSNKPLSKLDDELFKNLTLYRIIVGSLQYITITRPDIAFTVNKVAQFMHSPSNIHWTTVKHILRYLNGSSTHGLTLQASQSMHLHAYSDSDWASCPDDRRSTTGFCVFLGASLISWSSKKQQIVSRSSTDVEYRSLVLVSVEVIWIQFLLAELHFPTTTPPIL